MHCPAKNSSAQSSPHSYCKKRRIKSDAGFKSAKNGVDRKIRETYIISTSIAVGKTFWVVIVFVISFTTFRLSSFDISRNLHASKINFDILKKNFLKIILSLFATLEDIRFNKSGYFISLKQLNIVTYSTRVYS